MSAQLDISSFSPHIFWDCNRSVLDMETDKEFIIERVFTRGLEKDEIAAISFYGKDIIKNVIVAIKNMDMKICNYLSVIFNIPIGNFRCCKPKP